MKRSLFREVVLFAACAVFTGTAGLILLDSVIMPRVVRKGQQVQVPNIVDMAPRRASRTLARYGLILKVQPARWDTRIAKGHLLSQNPEAFSLVKSGRTVYAVLSKGTRFYTVPDVRKKSKRLAQLLVQQSGLLFGDVDEKPSETVPEGQVIRQEPAPGRSVDGGSTVYVVLSNGPPREAVQVPNLVGMKLNAARSALKASSLEVRDIHYRFSTAYVPDTVIGHEPAAGEEVKGGSKVRLVVSKL